MKDKKTYNFVVRITSKERTIISELKKNGINISAFLRMCLIKKHKEEIRENMQKM